MDTIRTVHDLAATIRGARLDRRWSQAELARRAHVSRSWLVDLEAGKRTAEIGRVLQVFDALDIELQARARTGAGAPPPGAPTRRA